MDTREILVFIEKINRVICSPSTNEHAGTGEFLKIEGSADAALLPTGAWPLTGSGVSHNEGEVAPSIASRSSELRRSGP